MKQRRDDREKASQERNRKEKAGKNRIMKDSKILSFQQFKRPS